MTNRIIHWSWGIGHWILVIAVSANPEPLQSPRPNLHTLQWVGIGLVGLTALVLAAAHTPGRIRLLGLFAVAFGCVCGWGLARVATALKVNAGRLTAAIIAGVLIAAAETGLTLESWRLYVVELRQIYDPEASTEVVGKGQPFVPPSVLKKAREDRQRVLEEKSRFATYVQHRVKNLGEWPSPWPIVFWAAEVLLGTAAGVAAFLASRGSGRSER